MSGVYFNLEFFKRFLRLQRIVFPKWKSLTVLLFVFLLLLVILQQVVIYNVGMLPSKFYEVLGNKDLPGFRSHTLYALVLIISIAFITATIKYGCSVLYVRSRLLLTDRLHLKYFQDIVYYNVNVLNPVIDNPDQRITQDVSRMCKQFSLIIADLLISPFTITYYFYKTWAMTGYIGPVCVLVFFIISTIFNKLLMSPVVALVFQQEQKEGDFRFKHMQMRTHAESAAFYRSGNIELMKTNSQLNALINTQQRLVLKEYALNFSISMADYLGSILSYCILAIPIFSGVYDDLTPTELSALISQNAFITIYLISCFTRLIDMSINAADIAGTAHRVGQLLEVLEEEAEKCAQLQGASSLFCDISSADNLSLPAVAYEVNNMTYTLPMNPSKILVKDLDMQVTQNCNLLVTGDSGCGKSSLLRVLNKLWKPHKGWVKCYVDHGPNGVMYLPQHPFLTDGSLRAQIIYPEKESSHYNTADDAIMKYIKEADLLKLHERTDGLDSDQCWNWYDILSPGEMQRLSFVRLFYHRPPFAVLDEASSQIGVDMERHMYDMCAELNITLVSVGHRSSLRAFHQKQLHLDGQGGWSLTDISPRGDRNHDLDSASSVGPSSFQVVEAYNDVNDSDKL